MTCPLCHQSADPAARVGNVAVCAKCGCTVRLNGDDTPTIANASDTTGLSDADLGLLRNARGKIVRPRRREA